jgi:O-antigen/teichoic acid export membrane protein
LLRKLLLTLFGKLNRFNSLQVFQLLRLSCLFVIAILISKIFKNETLVISQYETLLLAGSSLSAFWISGITNTLLPYYNHSVQDQRPVLLFNIFMMLGVLSVGAFVVLYFWGSTIFLIEENLIRLYGLFIMINAPTYMVEYMLFLRHRYHNMIRWGVLIFTLQVLITVVPLYYGYTLQQTVQLLIVFAFFKLVATLFIVSKHSLFRFDREMTGAFFLQALPVIFAIFLGSTIDYFNSLLIKKYKGPDDFAIFRYGAREFPIFLIMANTFSNVMSGEIASFGRAGKLQQGLANLKLRSAKLMHYLFPAAMAFMLFSKPLFRLLYNEQLSEGHAVFNIYLMLIIARMLFPQTVLLGLHRSRSFYFSSVAEVLVNMVLAWFFINWWGIEGAAFAVLAAFVTEKLILIWFCHINNIRVQDFVPVKLFLLYSTACILCYAAARLIY